MAQGDKPADELVGPDGIGPEAGDGDIQIEDFASRCPHCGRPMSSSDEGVIVWT